jgi:hypothetical protein
MVVFLYTMRRVDCRDCGVRVEEVPWGICGFQRKAARYSDFIAATIPT